jgi:alpha-N-arabinofuranosidase
MMHCYAPLFVNVNPGAMQWTTDLIGYNTMSAYGSPAYWAQHMFANHVGDSVLNIVASGIPYREWQQMRRTGGPARAADTSGLTPPTAMPTPVPEMFFSATRDTANGTIYVKMVNRSAKPQQVNVSVSGLTSIAPAGKSITLSSVNIGDTNSITDPHKVEPVTADVIGLGTEFSRTVPANSITVLELSGK